MKLYEVLRKEVWGRYGNGEIELLFENMLPQTDFILYRH